MKYIVLGALLASVNAIRKFEGASNFVVEEHDEGDYPAYMHGFGGYHTYMRDIPDRFETESDDILMHSLYNTYATEGRKNDLPTGEFWVDKANARLAALEVVGTHLHLNGKAGESYLKTEFENLWKRFDVNEEGKLEIDRMPMFLRQICGNTEACVGL